MNIEELTLGEIKQLSNLINNQKCDLTEKSLGKNIVILQRGWVFVGDLFKKGHDCRLENASVVRIWGTKKGLGEIAKDGPKLETILDPTPVVSFHELTVIATIKCEEEKWK
jgi:hypothetical protein